MKTYTYHVTGTHCASCKILIEDIVGEQEYTKNVDLNLKKEILTLETDSIETPESLLNKINEKISANGYSLSMEKVKRQKEDINILVQAIPIGIVFLVLFFALQKSGILNLGIGGGATPVTAFVIGLIASVSSCLAIVGGLIFSLSAKMASDGERSNKPIVLFHFGRVVGFAILGGVLGLIGREIGVSFTLSALLGLLASSVMIILGLNLVGVFKKNTITLPSGIFKLFRQVEHATLTPILIGIGTFFLPCGFTQSMQLAALSSGSYTSGFGIMLGFALGTLPVLALVSFGSLSFAQSKYAPLFFKSAGVVVLGLGLFAFLSGLVGLGIINPIFNI